MTCCIADLTAYFPGTVPFDSIGKANAYGRHLLGKYT